MKGVNILFILITVLVLSSFLNGYISNGNVNPVDVKLYSSDITEYDIVEIDGCEYIHVLKRPAINAITEVLVHKGNCKNPIHTHSK